MPTAGSWRASATSISCCSSSPISSGPRCTCSPTGWSAAVSRLDVGDAEANRVFRRDIRHALENFLRFEHRYWFHEISNQAQARELYSHDRGSTSDLDALYRDIREELQDMGNFLDVDAMRRQNETVVRLTVVTTFGLIGTVCTGFLGMNLLAWAEHPTELRVLAFLLVLIVTSA